MVNRNLNALYNRLLLHSPNTTTVDLPAEVGTGEITQTVTRQGVAFSDWRMSCASDTDVRGDSSEAYVQLIFCLSEGISWDIAGERRSVSLKRGESCIYRGHGRTEYLCYAQNRDFHFRGIKIPVPCFEEILSDNFAEGEAAVYKKKLLGDIATIPITPRMERILAELNTSVYGRGGAGNLFLEGKLYELLAVCLSEVLELNDLTDAGTPISRSDRDSILEAKRIIDGQLAYAPDCRELARRVGISTSKLAKGFSAVYGTPIHAYIIDQRLERAASLLLESGLNVSEISSLVGYSKPSNFSAAFKKKYGVLPKRYGL